ncbi:MAG: phosphotransferase [Anaerolineales bacterium]
MVEEGKGSQALLGPPADVPEILRGSWLQLPSDDPVALYLVQHHREASTPPGGWEVARLSHTAYIYRERSTGRAVIAKFYVVKTGDAAPRHARQELEQTRRVRAADLAEGRLRAVRPLSVWRGVLFLEYVEGLTLEGIIAVRRNRPGTLAASLTCAARFLAALHTRTPQPSTGADFAPALTYTHKVVEQLTKHGVLQEQLLTQEGVRQLISRWADRQMMRNFTPALNHGDMTTTNFIFPTEDEVVVIDWERLEVADPAADLGRLMAEVTHSITRHGGSVPEALSFVEHLTESYRTALPEGWDAGSLLERARFYRASSTLRIARNGWLSRLERTTLVAQAMALLVS